MLIVCNSVDEPTDPNIIAWRYVGKTLNQYNVEIYSHYRPNFLFRKDTKIEIFNSYGNGLLIVAIAADHSVFTIIPELYYTRINQYKDYYIANAIKLVIHRDGYEVETIEKKIRYFRKTEGQIRQVFDEFKTPIIVAYTANEIVMDEKSRYGYGIIWKGKKGPFLWIRDFYIDGKMMYADTGQAKYRINLETGQGEYYDWQESDTDIPIVRFPKDK